MSMYHRGFPIHSPNLGLIMEQAVERQMIWNQMMNNAKITMVEPIRMSLVFKEFLERLKNNPCTPCAIIIDSMSEDDDVSPDFVVDKS